MHACPSHGRRAMASLVFQSGKNLNAAFERMSKRKKKALLRSPLEAAVLLPKCLTSLLHGFCTFCCTGASKAVCSEGTVFCPMRQHFSGGRLLREYSTKIACEQASRLGTATIACADRPFLRSPCITRNMPFYCARSRIVLESPARDSHPSALAPRGCASGSR